MQRVKRTNRIAAMTRILTLHPNEVFTLSYFSDLFYVARSTISEDITIINETLEEYNLGYIHTITGAAGGIEYIPISIGAPAINFIKDLSKKLSNPGRILPGGFLYLNDILYTPQFIRPIGQILAGKFIDKNPDFIITIETKGIPVALMTAEALGCPVVVARRGTKVTEGSSVSINYVTASSGRVQTMYLSRRSVISNSKALIIDDFMKGGGSAKGLIELLKEFDVEIIGTGVVIATKEPDQKLISNYFSLMILEGLDEDAGKALISPSRWLYRE